MGLSIHYSGTIKDAAQIPKLIEEVQDVCTIFDWHYQFIDDESLTGIFFTPPGCETLCLSFLPNGQLASWARILYDIEPATVISVKTQFAGMDVHKTIIKLLQYLSAKYFSRFDLQDEGGYWETGDETVLARQFDIYDGLLNKVQSVLSDFKVDAGATKEELVKRLEEFLKERLKN
jgi:hypothetical protein